jgi:hypothetical protein
MDRAELERLDREGLVLRAQAAGIRRARLLTRPELVDELLRLSPVLDENQLKKTRGFFGRARDLLSRVVERGLHLPDAADRLRAALGDPLPQVPRPEPQAVPTVTLAEIYAAQGHKQRAIETLRRVLETEPDHGAARALIERLQAADYVPPPLPLPPEVEDGARDEIGANLGNGTTAGSSDAEPASEEPAPETASIEPPPETASRGAELDAELATASHEPETPRLDARTTVPRGLDASVAHDECVAIPLHEAESYVWWHLSEPSRRRLAEAPSFFFVRAVILVPTWDGPQQETRDIACDPSAGEVLLQDLPRQSIVRVAVGLLDAGTFIPLAHSPPLETGVSQGLVRWTLEGARPIALEDPESASIARAVAGAARAAGLVDRG